MVEQATSLGNQTAVNGWFRRAERLLADAALCPAQAKMLMKDIRAAVDEATS